ncbi:hypothetical protein AYJ57_25405 (plasmid) [Salipiger sp. CCB-MM3]|nr:hypothetical protein AYJ57_25405 [Salipiger sp. CCB-MM3]
MRGMPGIPYDGHPLAKALEQVETFTELAVVDRGDNGHGLTRTRDPISGMPRRVTEPLKAQLRRRSAIEPEIGHMKIDGRLAGYTPKGAAGDAIFAVLCGCGHNIRTLLAYLRTLLSFASLGWRARSGTRVSGRSSPAHGLVQARLISI